MGYFRYAYQGSSLWESNIYKGTHMMRNNEPQGICFKQCSRNKNMQSSWSNIKVSQQEWRQSRKYLSVLIQETTLMTILLIELGQ